MCVRSLDRHALSLSKAEKDLKGYGDSLLSLTDITKSRKRFILQEICCAIFRLKTARFVLSGEKLVFLSPGYKLPAKPGLHSDVNDGMQSQLATAPRDVSWLEGSLAPLGQALL